MGLDRSGHAHRAGVAHPLRRASGTVRGPRPAVDGAPGAIGALLAVGALLKVWPACCCSAFPAEPWAGRWQDSSPPPRRFWSLCCSRCRALDPSPPNSGHAACRSSPFRHGCSHRPPSRAGAHVRVPVRGHGGAGDRNGRCGRSHHCGGRGRSGFSRLAAPDRPPG